MRFSRSRHGGFAGYFPRAARALFDTGAAYCLNPALKKGIRPHIAGVFCCLWFASGIAHGACSVQPKTTVTLTVSGTTILAPVTVNGIEGRFILDTGAKLTVVSPEAVARFGLALDEWTATTMSGIGGVERRRNAIPRSIALGSVPLHRRSVAGDSTLRVSSLPRAQPEGRPIDGLLGRDFLSLFDLDLDPPARRLTLYEVSGCAGRFVPWSGDYASVPVEMPADSALWVPVVVDGVPLRALLDSGAGTSLIAAPGMARLGLGLDRLAGDAQTVARGVGPRSVTMWRHRFGALSVGDGVWEAPTLLVAPLRLTPISDMLLGADWLVSRRVWVSYATRQVFVGR